MSRIICICINILDNKTYLVNDLKLVPSCRISIVDPFTQWAKIQKKVQFREAVMFASRPKLKRAVE